MIRYMQRYTPRKSKSNWSVINIERAEKMIQQGLMTKEGLEIFQKGIKSAKIIPSSKNFSVPRDFKLALKNDIKASNNFQNFPPSAQLAYVYWVDTAKTDKTRQTRIEKAIKQIAFNKRFGEK